MCGICGKVDFDPKHLIDACLLKRMADTMYHRALDDDTY